MLLAQDVATVFADGREDNAGHPVLSASGWKSLATALSERRTSL
ncbi:hypothetical protein GGD55_001858 [Rhizobium giardinii]|uniref:Uncharacterized protein n=1 Tax=Rhizobium giardinii TaxID=56731 RepID=A0A7W8UAF1_9HYPH|nr:hypothetical protein [Rhizobium giardinii]